MRAVIWAAESCRTARASPIETAIPGNLSLAVNGLFFALVGTKGPWIVTADTQAPHVEPGSIPPPVAVEQP